MPNSLDSDQARHYVGTDLDLNCLQGFLADDASHRRIQRGEGAGGPDPP